MKTPSVTVTYSGKFWRGHQPAIRLYAHSHYIARIVSLYYYLSREDGPVL